MVSPELTPAEEHTLNLVIAETKALTVKQIANRVPYSEIYVRKILDQLERKGFVYKTDNRQPYEFKATNLERRQQSIEKFVAMLTAEEEIPDTPQVIREIRKQNPETWNDKVIPVLQYIIEAIKFIETDESRIPTL